MNATTTTLAIPDIDDPSNTNGGSNITVQVGPSTEVPIVVGVGRDGRISVEIINSIHVIQPRS